MLRIKNDKWEEFCDNAEMLGFKYINNEICDDNLIKINAFTKEIFIYIIDDASDNFYEMQLDKLFDLIAAGFIKKVEASK